MKENVLDALLFMFDHASEEDHAFIDREKMTEILDQVGFTQSEVSQAFSWLDGLTFLTNDNTLTEAQSHSTRVFSKEEKARFSIDCQGFLHELEQLGVIDGFIREIIIDRALALQDELEIDLPRLKWMVMLVMMNLPDKESELAWVETWDCQYPLH